MTQRIAIIGSGMAGLAAGWMLQRAGHDVMVFESHPHRGMDAHTLDLDSGYVDVPLRVMSPHAWGNVLALSEQVGVPTFEVDTYATCSWSDGETWFRSSRLQVKNWSLPWAGAPYLTHAETWIMLRGFWRLWRAHRQLTDPRLTLQEFAERERFDPIFWNGLILPLLITICTCTQETLNRWPALELLTLLQKIVHGRRLLRLQGGTRKLVGRLGERLNFRSGSPVESVEVRPEGVTVRNARNESGIFDRLICAVQANHLDFLGDAFRRERKLLRDIPYDSGTLWVHRDPSFMPRNRQDWTALHYQIDRNLERAMFTVWVNPVEPTLAEAEPVFQTWSPWREPVPESVLAQVPLQRAVVGRENAQVLRQLDEMHAEPGRRVFFCGSYAAPGVPLLESAVRSAMNVVAQLGAQTPWEPQPSSSNPSRLPLLTPSPAV